MKTFLLSLFLILAIGATAQVTLHTDSIFHAKKECRVTYGPTKPQAATIVISVTRDTVTVNDKHFIYVNDTLGYRNGNDYVGLFYFTGLDGCFVFSVEYDERVILYQKGSLNRLNDNWVFLKKF